MRVAENTNRVQTLCQMLWILANDSLRGIWIQYDDDETAVIIFCKNKKWYPAWNKSAKIL